MYGDDALGVALALYRQPSMAAEWRERPLPDGVELLMRLACREQAALQVARQRSGLAESDCVEAATFGLQQLLFTAHADAYRVLGGACSSSQDQLRQHYRWLIKWLHPDRHDDGWESVYADRVNLAWQALKTPDRRARYEAEQGFGPLSGSATANSGSRTDESAAAHDENDASAAAVPDGFSPPVAFQGRTAVHARQGSHASRSPRAWKALAAAGLLGGLLLWAWPDGREAIDPGRGLPIAFAPQERATPQPQPQAQAGQPDRDVVDESLAEAGTQPGDAATAPGMASASSGLTQSATLPATGSMDPLPETASGSARGRADHNPIMEAAASVALSEPEAAGDPVAMTVDSAPADRPALTSAAAESRTPARQTMAGASPDSRASSARPAAAANARTVAAVDAPAAGPGLTPREMPAQTTPLPSRAVAAASTARDQPASAAKPPAAPAGAAALPVADAPTRLAPRQDPSLPVPRANRPAAATVAAASGDDRSSVDSSIAGADVKQDSGAALAKARAPRVDPPLAQAVVHRWVAAYSAGDSRQFDDSLAAGLRAPLLEQMRVRLVGASMRYLEVGEMQWEQGEVQLKARATVRETFVPQGGRKAETRAGQMRFAFALEQGEVKIAGIEFRSN